MRKRCEVCDEPVDSDGGGDGDAAAPCGRCGGRIARPELLAPVARRGPAGEYVVGLALALRGFKLTVSRPRLLALVAIPLVIDLALLVLLTVGLYSAMQGWLPALAEPWSAWLDWARVALAWLVRSLAGVVAFAVAALLMLMVSTVVNAPFLEWLSEAVESIVLGGPDPRPYGWTRFWRTFVVPLFQAVVLAGIQGAIGLVLLACSLSVVLAPVTALGAAWLLAIGLADVVVARKSYPVRGRFSAVRRSLPAQLGLVTPLTFAPFLLPLFVAGATLLHLRERRASAPSRRD